MKQQCTVDIKKIFAYVKTLLAQDVKFKNYDEVAKRMILLRNDKPDDVKIVALKAIAKIYENLTITNPGSGFSMGSSGAAKKLITEELQTADLETLFSEIKSLYFTTPKSQSAGLSVSLSLRKLTAGLLNGDKLTDIEIINVIKSYGDVVSNTLKRVPGNRLVYAKTMFLNDLTRVRKKVEDLDSISDTTKKLVLDKIEKINKQFENIIGYVPLSTTRYGDTYRIYDKNNNVELQVYLNNEDGKYYNIAEPTLEVDVTNKKLIPVVYDRMGMRDMEISQSGEFRILRYAEMSSGFQLRADVSPEVKNVLLSAEDPNSIMEVYATTKIATDNESRLKRIQEQIPERTLETFESYEQQLYMKQSGKPVAAVASPVSGISLYIKIPGNDGRIPIYDLSNYAVVDSNNKTTPIDFTDKTQWELIKSLFRKTDKDRNTKELTDYDLGILAENQTIINNFKAKAEDYLRSSGGDTIKLSKEFYENIINISKGGTSIKQTLVSDKESGVLLSDALKMPSNEKFMVDVSVVTVDEEGVVSQPVSKKVPLLIRREKGGQTFVFASGVLEQNQYVLDDNQEVTNLETYLQKKYPEALRVHNINPQFPKHIGYALVAKDGDKLTLVGMNRTFGANPLSNMLKFVMSLVDLKVKISLAPTEANRIMNEYNRFSYFMSPDNGWASDLSAYYDTKDKSVSFNFELRHLDDKSMKKYASDDEETKKLKAAARVYFPIDTVDNIEKILKDTLSSVGFQRFIDINYPMYSDVEKFLKSTGFSKNIFFGIIGEYLQTQPSTQQKIYDEYDRFTNSIKTNLTKAADKFSALGYALGSPRIYTMLENEKSNLGGRWYLKINDKSVDLNYNNFNQFRLMTQGEMLKPTTLFIDSPRSITTPIPASAEVIAAQPATTVVNPVVAPTSEKDSTISTDYVESDEEDAPFSLVEQQETVVEYNNQSWKSELDWIKANLPSDFSVDDLAKIMNSIKVDGRMLGYYKNMVIYLNKTLSGKGTGYHEAFHGVFRALLDSDQRDFYINKALSNISVSNDQIQKFRADRGLFHLTDNAVTRAIAEEYLADKFKEYKLTKKEPSSPWLRYFVRLLDKIVNFFTGKSKQIDDITALFNRIDSGYYKNARILNEVKSGVAEVLPSRPVVVGMKEDGTPIVKKNNFNTYNQNQLINRLGFEVSHAIGKTFEEKYQAAVKSLLEEYNIEKLIATYPNADAQKIRDKYTDVYGDIRFALGDKSSLTQNITGNNELTRGIKPEEVDEAAALLKSQVRKLLQSIDIKNVTFNPDAVFDEMDDEDQALKDKFDDNFGNINSLDGLSKQFRKFFSLLPYTQTDADTGVKVTKMVDGAKVYDAMMKISADVPHDKIISNLRSTIETIDRDQDNDEMYDKMSTVFNTLSNLFGLDELDKPTRNVNMYNQFMNTFFVTEIPTLIYHFKTTEEYGTFASVYDATIQKDITREIEKLKISYTQEYYRLDAKERKTVFEEASKILFTEVINPTDLGVEHKSILDAKVKAVKGALDSMGLHFSKSMIMFSLVNIDKENNPEKVYHHKTKAAEILAANPLLAVQGAYLQKDFFSWISGSVLGSNVNIFEKADFDEVISEDDMEEKDIIRVERTDQQNTQIKGVYNILKKAAKFMVKYNVDAAVSVFVNAENKNVYRYVKYTPLLLAAQKIKTEGIQGLINDYPFLEEWFNDNPSLSKKSKELELYLSNLSVSMMGGSRQTILQRERDGYTFKHMDPRTKHLIDITMFGQRDVIIKNKTEIVTYNRSYNILEATSTNFLIPSLYRNLYNKDGFVKNEETGEALVLSDLISQIGQEYNRIQREWSTREERKNLPNNFNNYNAILSKDEYGNTVVDTESDKLRAYHFNRLSKFFGKNVAKLTTYVHPDPDVAERRSSLGEQLREYAKNNIPFKNILKKPEYAEFLTSLKTDLMSYLQEEYNEFQQSLIKYKIVEQVEVGGKVIGITSNLIPSTIKTGIAKAEALEDKNQNLLSYLRDYFFNDYTSKLLFNQMFDGDMAITVKNGTMLGMRNKSSVISGDSMRDGYHRVAYINNIKVWVNKNDIADGQFDTYSQIPLELIAKESADWIQVDAADGQSYTTLEHRTYMYNKQGRLEESSGLDGDDDNMKVKDILEKARYQKLTNDEIRYLENARIVLGSYKTATGGLIDFIKQSEHIILRTDVSYIETGAGVTEQEVIDDFLKPLYKEIDIIKGYLQRGEGHVYLSTYNTTAIEALQDIYNDIHAYYKPLPGRETLHHMLNSMEYHGIDQLFDPNASKKASLLPVELNLNGYTDLSRSSRDLLNKNKFMQVETSGVSRKITVPTQKRQLIDTDIIMNDPEIPDSLKESVKDYRKFLAEVGQFSYEQIKLILDAPDNGVNIVPILNTMREGLQKQGADANILKYFELDENNQPKFNINLPMRKIMFKNYFFALYSKTVFGEKSSGRKDFEVSGFGYKLVIDENNNVVPSEEVKRNPTKYANYATRYPGIKKYVGEDGITRYVCEVIIPKPMFKTKQHEELFMKKLSRMMSTRIPTEDKRSMVVAEAVDYVDSIYQNIVILPQLVHILAGSDLDIDTLYSQTLATYEDFNDTYHVYGEYDTYTDVPQEKAEFIEYLIAKSDDETLEAEIDTELKRILSEPDSMQEIPEVFFTMGKYLGVPEEEGVTKELLRERLQELKELRNDYYTSYLSLKEERQVAFEQYVQLRTRNEELFKKIVDRLNELNPQKENESDYEYYSRVVMIAKEYIRRTKIPGADDGLPDFRLQGQYSAALRHFKSVTTRAFFSMRADQEETKDEAKEVRKIFSKIDRQFRMIATLNVLAKYNMPATLEDYAMRRKDYIKPLLQNKVVKKQMDILSHEYVYNNLWKNEKSDLSFYGNIVTSLGSSIDSVVDKYDINSPAWIVNVLNLNSSSDDGIGIAASNNKFLAFATKYNLVLTEPIWKLNGKVYGKYESVVQYGEDDYQRVIKKVGAAIGMFADAKKEPYPSILNLDADTASIAMSMIGIGLPEEAAYLMNIVPLIDKVIKEKQSVKSNTVDKAELYKRTNLISIAEETFYQEYAKLKKENRLGEVFKLKDGKVMYDKQGNLVFRDININFEFDPTPSVRTSAQDLGFTATYKDNGAEVSDDVVQLHLLLRYKEQAALNADQFHVVNILNLIKKLKPDFETLDKIVYSYNYLMGRLYKKPKFSNISKVLTDSKEYAPLLKSIEHMYSTAEKIFLERNPVFKVLNEELGDSMITYKMSDGMKSAMSSHVVKYVIVNKFKNRIKEALSIENAKQNPNPRFVKTYETILDMFTADFWVGKLTETVSSMDEDLRTLYDKYPDNPFVQFLKYKTKSGISLVEALSRMKLDSETSNQIIDGYNLLRSSIDDETRMIANKLYWYILVKDNLGMSNNTFINYLNPEVYESVSKDLDNLQSMLNNVVTSKKELANFFNGKLFSEYFNVPGLDMPSLFATIIYKALTNTNNLEYVNSSRRFIAGSNKGRLGKLDEKVLIPFLEQTIPGALKNDYNKVHNLPKEQSDPDFIDLLTPDSTEVDKGEVILDFEELRPVETGFSRVQDDVLSSLRVTAHYEFDSKTQQEQFKGFRFPMMLRNSQNVLLRLDTIDNKSVGEFIMDAIRSRIAKGLKDDFKFSGFKARYVVSQPEGTFDVNNNAFSTEDARMLNSFTVNSRTYPEITATKELKDFFASVISKYRVPPAALELLQRWIKKDVDLYGMIKFGKKGFYSVKYSLPNEDRSKPDYDFVIELKPASNGDGLSLKATQYSVIDSLKTPLFSKEFKAVEYQKMSKEERAAYRLAEKQAQINNKTAALLGISVEEAIAKGYIPDPNAKLEALSGEGTITDENQKQAYDKIINEIDNLFTEEEVSTFYKTRILDLKNSANISRMIQDDYFNKAVEYFEDRMDRIYAGEIKKPDQPPTPPPPPAAPKPPVVITQQKLQPFSWSKESPNGYEVSSKADTSLGKRFSAMNARLNDGRSIEEVYQLDIKGYRSDVEKMLADGEKIYVKNGKSYDMTSTRNWWVYGKGKPAKDIKLSREGLYKMYLELWRTFAKQNLHLISELLVAANGKVLTDYFATTEVNQARALSDILNEVVENPGSYFQSMNTQLENTIKELQNRCNK
jgi:hypothetical protein